MGATGCHTSRMVIARMVIDSKGVTATQKYTVIIVWYYLPMVWESVRVCVRNVINPPNNNHKNIICRKFDSGIDGLRIVWIIRFTTQQ